jgi:hypothetical protein
MRSAAEGVGMMRVPDGAARGSGRRKILAALAWATVLLGLTHSQALAAPPPNCAAKAPTIDFIFDFPAPVLDNTLSQPELQRLADSSGIERHGGRTLGLYWLKLGVPFTMNVRGVTSGDTVCMSVADISVRIVAQERRIYVMKEWKEGTCPYTSILAHERKHQAVDDKLLRERAAIAKRKIAEAVARIGVVSVAKSQQASAQERLKTLVNDSIVKQVTEQILDVRKKAQADVDAGLEYSRVSASCREFRAAR